MGKQWKQWQTLFSWAQKSLKTVTEAMKLKMLAPWKKSYDEHRQYIRKQRHYFVDKGPSSKDYGFSSSHEWMWELDHEENWVPKNWCFWTLVLEKTLKSPLDCKEIKPVLKEINLEYSLERLMLNLKLQYCGHLDVNSRLIGKDPNAGKYWGREEKGTTEDEMVGWHHRLNGREFVQTLGDSEGQESLACCSSWGHRVKHDLVTE